MFKFLKNKNKAFGLVEALLALAVFGTTIIAATSVTIQSLRTIKDNELADFSNSVMVRSLELAKSNTATIQGSGQNSTAENLTSGFPGPWVFSIAGDLDDLDGDLTLVRQQAVADRIQPDTSTSTLAAFQVDAQNQIIQSYELYNQIYIQEIENSDNLEIISRIVYTTGNEYVVNEIRGYKPAQ